MEFHEAANLFPMMTGAEFDELCTDISDGYDPQFPIITIDNKILDGRNRYAACLKVGVEPLYQEYRGHDSPLVFVTRANLHRRHLTASQRAAFAVEALPMLETEARKRQIELAGTRPNTSDLSEMFQQGIDFGKSSEKAAELFGTNMHYVHDAKRIAEEAPEILEQVKAGELTIPAALRQIDNRPHVANNSGNNDWYTPPEIIAKAKELLGNIDLDPASSELANKTVGAAKYFTAQDDGLKFDWIAGTLWMNPPYAQPAIEYFTEKLVNEFIAGNVTEALVLVNNATETGWFQYMLYSCAAVCFLKGRVKFIDMEGKPSGAPLQGQAILYFGDNLDGFIDIFSTTGKVLCNPA